MNIVLINTEEELKSFPITQSIKLKSDIDVEVNDLKNTIYLFEVTRKDSLVKLSNPFSYNLSLIKRDYDFVDLTFKKSVGSIPNTFVIEVTPTKPLDLLSTYLLYVDKKISTDFLSFSKVITKSLSTIEVNTANTLPATIATIEIVILETSRILKNQNILKVGIKEQGQEYKVFSLDLKKQRTVEYLNLDITFISDIYIKDEVFNINIEARDQREESYSYLINTCGHSDILPMALEEASTKLSHQAILDFYNTPITPNVPVSYTIKYLSINTVSINLPETISKSDVDIASIIISNKHAFNNYLLNNLKLYDTTNKYILSASWDDIDNSIILDLYYTPEELQNNQQESIALDLTNW